MDNRDKNIEIIRNWMDFFNLNVEDLGFDDKFIDLNQLDDDAIDQLLDEAEEDRMRSMGNGEYISEDYS